MLVLKFDIRYNYYAKGGSMRKKIFFFLMGTIILIAGIGFFLYVYGFKISVPRYEDEYFTRELLAKYSSPEMAFKHFVSALENGNPVLYQEVLGRKFTEKEVQEFKSYDGKRPQIEKKVEGKDYVYIVTDNGWGEHFEKVKSRWVFTPEDWGVLVRELFR